MLKVVNRKISYEKLTTLTPPLTIASMNDGIVPLEIGEKSEETQIEDERLLKEKSLVFVAATRAKKSLVITSYGMSSVFLLNYS